VFVEHLPVAQKQHWRILRAIGTGDPDLVEDAVRKHNQSALRAYEEHLKKCGPEALALNRTGGRGADGGE
ncbi:MAG: hypothetical protein JO308_12710, partial [Verrucomicrobia bacterium]|nr:hypothetical protein [Verrucomicrobiota bacterium]